MATTQKQVKTRIQQKHDTSENWGKATSFIPLKGEIIVYDDLGRIKVGDGTKTVANLKFVDEHPHPYLPLTGGTIAGNLTVSGSDGKSGKITTRQLSIEYAEINVAGTSGTGIFIAANDAETMLTIRTDGLQFYANKNKVIPTWTFTGISDTKGVSSTLAASLKCLNDNYLPLTGGTLTGDLNFSSTDYDMTVGTDGVDVAYTNGDGRTELRPNSIICTNSGGKTATLNADGLNFDKTNSIITGISDSKGTSSRIAVSQKCLTDNYLPLSGGTLTGALTATKFTGNGSGLTSIPAGQLTGTISSDRLPDLSTKYLPLTGGEVSGSLGVRGEDGVMASRFVGGAFMGTGCSVHPTTSTETAIDIEPSGEGENTYLSISTNSFTHYSDFMNDVADWTFTGISDSKGTSTTLAMSQKGVADNYLALSGGTLTGQLTLSSNGIKFNTNAIKDITYSTTDLTAGTSTLATNSIYIVYE